MILLMAVLCCAVLLSGCSFGQTDIDRAMDFRDRLLESNGCRFQCEVTADYGEKIYTFTLDCEGNRDGDLTVTVCEPESIAGITAVIEKGKGSLRFDDTALAFPLLADGGLSPISGPWLLIKTLRTGYLTSAGKEDNGLNLMADDSFEADALHLDIHLDGEDAPVCADIFYKEQKILSLGIKNFEIL